MLSADVSAAFLKGEFQDKDRILYCWPPKNGPGLPNVPDGALILIKKGVFGLNDAPRKWWTKVSETLISLGFKKQAMCIGMFLLYDQSGRLAGMVCLHVDDFLGAGNELFEQKITELDRLLGFGSIQRQ